MSKPPSAKLGHSLKPSDASHQPAPDTHKGTHSGLCIAAQVSISAMLLGPQHETKHTVDANTQTSRQEIEGDFRGRQKLHKKPNRGPSRTAAARMLKGQNKIPPYMHPRPLGQT